MLVDGSRGALVDDVHYNLRVVTGLHRSPEVEQVPHTGKRDHECEVLCHELLSDAVNFEKVHTLASIVLIQRSFEPNFVTQAT